MVTITTGNGVIDKLVLVQPRYLRENVKPEKLSERFFRNQEILLVVDISTILNTLVQVTCQNQIKIKRVDQYHLLSLEYG